jgi:hypothetical protein
LRAALLSASSARLRLPAPPRRAAHSRLRERSAEFKANFADAKALALLSATRAAAARYSAHETDGLSRNPDDCAKHGCIDNGGS